MAKTPETQESIEKLPKRHAQATWRPGKKR